MCRSTSTSRTKLIRVRSFTSGSFRSVSLTATSLPPFPSPSPPLPSTPSHPCCPSSYRLAPSPSLSHRYMLRPFRTHRSSPSIAATPWCSDGLIPSTAGFRLLLLMLPGRLPGVERPVPGRGTCTSPRASHTELNAPWPSARTSVMFVSHLRSEMTAPASISTSASTASGMSWWSLWLDS
jgi:hypothetical protein